MPLSFQLRNRQFSAGWVGIWLCAELFVFLLVAGRYGFGAALLAQIVSMLVGAVLLRRLGRNVLNALQQGLRADAAPESGFADGLVAAFGAVLFVLPGFLSTAVAVALSVPFVRRIVSRRLVPFFRSVTGKADSGGTEALDLDPAEWTRNADHGPDEKFLPPR